MPNVLVTGYLV